MLASWVLLRPGQVLTHFLSVDIPQILMQVFKRNQSETTQRWCCSSAGL